MEIGRGDNIWDRYQAAKNDYYQGSEFRVVRMFDIRDEGVHFVGVTRALFNAHDECFLNFYFGQPLLDNFTPASTYHNDPFEHLNDPSDGGPLRLISPEEIQHLKYRETGTVWACLSFLVPDSEESTSDVSSDAAIETSPEDESSDIPFDERIDAIEDLIIGSLPEMMEAAWRLSRSEDLFVPDLTPEPADALDHEAKTIDWADFQNLPRDKKVAMLARRFGGDFEWEPLDTDSDFKIEDWADEDAKRVRGEIPWNPPERHPKYQLRPHADFVAWLESYVKSADIAPPADAVLNCWEAALVIAIMVGNLDAVTVKRDAEVGDTHYIMKYFASGHAHYDLKSLRNDIKSGDFIALVEGDELSHVAVVIGENKEDYQEIMTMSLYFHDNNRLTKIKWGKMVESAIYKLDIGAVYQPDNPATGVTGLYFLYGPFTL
ncbi:MAG: hypothetical protein H0T78_02315 [Longispora sp.]|nr:hypothetical protein [Longispora sp. (in: high G+C Gram-positive bacteria)]